MSYCTMDENSEPRFMWVPAGEIIPVYDGSIQKQMQYALRYCPVTINRSTATKVELYDTEKVTYYILERDVLRLIYDVIRYTSTTGHDRLAAHYSAVITELELKGYGVLRVRNTWLDEANAYKGVNVVLESPNKQKFELQFHTPESFDMKQNKMHILYEEARLSTTPKKRKEELYKMMYSMAKQLEKPLNVDRIINVDAL